jgi:hypothetical protein
MGYELFPPAAAPEADAVEYYTDSAPDVLLKGKTLWGSRLKPD